jgi:hypothetical protein
MSIHDFYSKLILGNENNSLLRSLRRLSQIKDVREIAGGGTSDPTGDWGQWPSVTAAQQNDGGLCPAV